MKILILLATTVVLVTARRGALQNRAGGNNLFTAALYKEALKENQGNFLVSPFSIQTILALTQSGAKDETAGEIRQALYLPRSSYETERLYASLLPSLKGNPDYALHTANKIYVKRGYPLNSAFTDKAASVFQAGVENVDFSQKYDAASAINGWVEKQTNNKIHDLIDPAKLDEDTRVILINALYFKGKWLYPFETYATAKDKFYRTRNDVVEVDTMRTTEVFNYYESPELNAKFLEMPYEGEDVSMVIVLPNDKEGLPALEARIENVFAAPRFTSERVSVSLPKFAIENKVQLKKILQNLGIRKAFSDEADLSGIAGKQGDLSISDVVQKAFINVTEAGTEAAAATAVQLGYQIAMGPPKYFTADHPFVFYIKFKNTILFNGKVTSPSN